MKSNERILQTIITDFNKGKKYFFKIIISLSLYLSYISGYFY